MRPCTCLIRGLAALVASQLAVLPALAATTGNVVITGTVPAACNITVNTLAGASIADLTQGATHLQVATVEENCNNPNGYTVDMIGSHSGSYGGRFVDSVSGDTLDFSIRYDDASVNNTRVTDVNAPDVVTKNVDISYPSDNTLTASSGATYSETIGFTITSK